MRRVMFIVVAAVSVAAVTAAFAFLHGRYAEGEPFAPQTVSADELAALDGVRVFFAHQSVGVDIIEGTEGVYRSHGLDPPRFVELAEAGPQDALVHVRIGENGDPLGKITEFEALIRGGLGDEIDVAVLKLCYVDVREDTDVEEIFTAYRDTLAELGRDYPEVTFVPATVPVSVRRGPLGTLKGWLGRGDNFGAEHNVTRQELNTLIRDEYAHTHRLFDIAAIQSTDEHGDRVAGTHGGDLYYALAKGLARDAGHLNETGGLIAAQDFLAAAARAVRDRRGADRRA